MRSMDTIFLSWTAPSQGRRIPYLTRRSVLNQYVETHERTILNRFGRNLSPVFDILNVMYTEYRALLEGKYGKYT
jgi:hypothetical protein